MTTQTVNLAANTKLTVTTSGPFPSSYQIDGGTSFPIQLAPYQETSFVLGPYPESHSVVLTNVDSYVTSGSSGDAFQSVAGLGR